MAVEIPDVPRLNLNGAPGVPLRTRFRVDVGSPTREKWAGKTDAPPSPSPNVPSGGGRSWAGKGGAGVLGKDISAPVLNHGT